MKRICWLAVLLVFMLPGLAYGVDRANGAAAGGLSVTVDGHGLRYHPDWNPYLDLAAQEQAEAYLRGGQTFVPLRLLAEALGAQVSYAQGAIQVSLPEGGELRLRLGNRVATLNGEKISLGAAPYLQRLEFRYLGERYTEELTYVPLRLIAEALGATVDYQEDKGLVAVASGKPLTAPGDVELSCMTVYNCQGMSARLTGYWGYERVAGFWQLLQEGRLRRVSEPRTEYGDLVGFWDYYNAVYHVGFYDREPVYDVDTTRDAENASFRFVLYMMYEGQPEFGSDSRFLLHNETDDTWWVMDEELFNRFIEQLERGGELLSYQWA